MRPDFGAVFNVLPVHLTRSVKTPNIKFVQLIEPLRMVFSFFLYDEILWPRFHSFEYSMSRIARKEFFFRVFNSALNKLSNDTKLVGKPPSVFLPEKSVSFIWTDNSFPACCTNFIVPLSVHSERHHNKFKFTVADIDMRFSQVAFLRILHFHIIRWSHRKFHDEKSWKQIHTLHSLIDHQLSTGVISKKTGR